MAVSLRDIQKNFNTQRKCRLYLEKLRWGKTVKCPYCESAKTNPAKSEQGRHSCQNCKRTFSVFIGTIFEDTRIELPVWFLTIALMLNAKNGISAMELQRHLGVNSYKTLYYMAMRIRIGMLEEDSKLTGIIELDQAFLGGSPRKKHPFKDKSSTSISTVKLKRKKKTKKIPVVGMVQRKGDVRTKVIEKLSKRNMVYMLKTYVKSENAILVTDAHKSNQELSKYIERLEITHKKHYSRGIVHINTIEGFWSHVKNGIRSNYKAISPKYLPFYLIEFEWKYNHRNYRGNQLDKYLKNALSHEKELEYWKAKSPLKVKQIAYEKDL